MTKYGLLFLLLLFLSACQPQPSDQQGAGGRWVSLFNGKDLDGWQVRITGHELGDNYGKTFRVENGMLSVRYDQYDSFSNQFGALYYRKPFSEYRLRVEYRFVGETAPGAPEWGFRDSGVQYHGQDPETMTPNQPFPICLEYNLHGGNGVDERPIGQICANGITVEINGQKNESYCTMPSIRKTFHGDQWVTLEIEVRQDTIRHFVNGEQILQFENPRYDPANNLAKSLIQEGEDTVRSGYISLQSNSHPIDFRKIEILEY